MRVTVTGGARFICSRIVGKLLEKGHEVVIVDREMPCGIDKSKVLFRIGDFRNIECLRESLSGTDIVYHLAEYHEDIMLNAIGTLNVLEACRTTRPKKILYASSFHVYDGLSENMVVNEETLPNIFNTGLFGSTKIMGEVLVRDLSIKYGIEYVILRLGPAYGFTHGLKESNNAVRSFIESGLRGEPIEVMGEGRRRCQYTFVDDLADGCILALKKANETYNIISPDEVTTGEIAELLKRKYGFEVLYDATREEGPSMPYISPRKAMRELGWVTTPLEESVHRTYLAIKEEHEHNQ
jgi:UDP-glucose 4-epimerase